MAESWLEKGDRDSPFPRLLAGWILPCWGFPGQLGQAWKPGPGSFSAPRKTQAPS